MECREIRIRLAPSRRITGAAGALHLLAVAAVSLAALPAPLAWALRALLLFGALRGWRDYRRERCRSTWLIRARDGYLLERDGVRQPAVLDGGSTLLGPVVVLRLHAGGRRHVFVLARDGLGVNDWRRLRVLLRMGGVAVQPGVRIVSSASGASSG
ncbi:MAG: hypothetical protein CALGDGBN_03021 [Pseudomonadales bacterium]|nr:hypothetical protein [Pseudomonadales bacterium]